MTLIQETIEESGIDKVFRRIRAMCGCLIITMSTVFGFMGYYIIFNENYNILARVLLGLAGIINIAVLIELMADILDLWKIERNRMKST